MTTKVTITTHDWPVNVTKLNLSSPSVKPEVSRVKKNSEQDFYVHSSLDLHIHEIQPNEKDYEWIA